jgi:hypothetical protein
MILLGLTGMSVTAHALEAPGERARVVLAYGRSGTAVKTCPDEATFRALVAARLGYDAFVDASKSEDTLTLRVEFRPRGGFVAGSLELLALGSPRGDRTMNAAPADCYELAASLALAAAVAVDPEGALAQKTAASAAQPPPSSAQAPQPALPSSPSTRAPPAPLRPPLPSAEKTALARFLHAGAVISVGIQPGTAPGIRLGGGLGRRAWSIGLEAAAFLPSERERSYGTVSAHALYGSLLPCLHPGSARLTVDVCTVASVGALFSDAEAVTRSQAATDLYATVGARVGLTFRASDALGFTLDAEAPVALSRVHLLVDDAGVRREVWAAGRIGFIGGARVVLKLH